MDIASILLVILGLAFFEAISSIDNAIINADILGKMSDRGKRWFLLWGLLIAVVVVRGLLPFLIILAANPSLGPVGVLSATFSNDPATIHAIDQSSPVVLIGGGMFLVLLFLHWLLVEPKRFGLPGEEFMKSHGRWFFVSASMLLAAVVWFAIERSPALALSAIIGAAAFFLVQVLKENAEKAEVQLCGAGSGMSDLRMLLYLEVIDASFSIDGVVGAFAFTLAVPLILIGNGIGALVVRELTVRHIENLKRYVFLKNGAMYSAFFLGAMMLMDGFGFGIPAWVSPLATFAIVGFFYWKSVRHLESAK